MVRFFKYPLVLVAAVLAVTAVGCQQQGNPVTFSVTIPQPNAIDFQATLTQHYGIGLTGSFALPNNIGTINLAGETPAQGFGIGATINTSAFLKASWVGYQEVTTLPTGAAFPNWMSGPVLDVVVPSLNQKGIDFHFYFGDHGQYYLGVAGVISAINGSFPAVNIGYTFYDNSNNVVLGFQFFGPKLAQNGQVSVPGGIFIGTNLTPLLPKPTQPAPKPTPGPANALVASTALRSNVFSEFRPVQLSGVSATSDVQTSGPDAHHYTSKRAVQGLLNRFFSASRNPF